MKAAAPQHSFWSWLDRTWLALASVRLTIVVFFLLLALSIPGMVILQFNVSSVDPGMQYEYDFWKFGQITQLFQAYHSFWYTGLIAILAMNLIACSVERWPQMLKLALAKPVLWAKTTFIGQPAALRFEWKTKLSPAEFQKRLNRELAKSWLKPVVLKDDASAQQFFWQAGRWSRVANYLVHTSLLMVFAGAIISAMYGFEGAANIPTGSAVDTFIVFNEGKGSGLLSAPGGLLNERLLGFRVQAEDFHVSFYEDFPGRPEAFVSKLNFFEKGELKKSAIAKVNEPITYKNFVFYQSSYGRMGDFKVEARAIDKNDPNAKHISLNSTLGEPKKLEPFGVELVPIQAALDVQGLGPAVQFQEVKDKKPVGKAFWVLKKFPQFDFEKRAARYWIVLDDVKELYFTGLQIAHDPGAPVYWLGCFGMLLGTFYALFITHRKYHLQVDWHGGHAGGGDIHFAGTINRLPFGFEKHLSEVAKRLQALG